MNRSVNARAGRRITMSKCPETDRWSTRLGIQKKPKTDLLVRINRTFSRFLIPESHRPKILHTVNLPTVSGHLGGRNICRTLRKEYFWPEMAADVDFSVRICIDGANETVSTQPYNNSPAPLGDVVMDLLIVGCYSARKQAYTRHHWLI